MLNDEELMDGAVTAGQAAPMADEISHEGKEDAEDIVAVTGQEAQSTDEPSDGDIKITPKELLRMLYGPQGTAHIRIINDKKGGTFTGMNMSCICDEFDAIAPQLERHNSMGRAISFVVNEGGHKDEDITRITAQFVDMDKGSIEEQWEKVKDFPLPPSMVNQTRRSLHVYWLMDDTADVKRFRPIQKRLAKQFDGDPACVNESRTMRLPGYMHHKTDEPVEVKCVLCHPERQYSQDQLDALLPPLEESNTEHYSGIAHEPGTEQGLNIVLQVCEYIKYCRIHAETLSEPEWHAMITNLACFEGGEDKIKELSSPYPGYSEKETMQKIRRFKESGAGPMTCQSIADLGFKCPKFDAGGCGVKSPAALCKKPVPAETLMEIIEGLPISGKLVRNVQTAKEFVETFLYNQDALTAGAIIDGDLRTHFNLEKTSVHVKELHKLYSELSKKSKTKKKDNQSAAFGTLPQWYEPAGADSLRFLPGVLARYLADTEHVICVADQYYKYKDGVYRKMSEAAAQKIVKGHMIDKEAHITQINDAEKQWRLLVQREADELNAEPLLINVRNGLYDVREGRLKAHTPEHLSTIQLHVSFREDAECPQFLQFLNETMQGDTEQIGLIQEMMGYCLIPGNRAQKSFVLVGVAAAGKTVLLRVMSEVVVGIENVSNVPWQALNERFKSAELFGKLMNVFADLPTKNIDDNGIFKTLVGEDYITAERKHQHPFSYQNKAKLIFSCNSIPMNYGDKSEGFYRRLIIIPFGRAVPVEDRDPELVDKLGKEADGIFLFALDGLKRLMKNNYKFATTQVNDDALQSYREASNSVLSFAKERCDICPDSEVFTGSQELYDAYVEYCKESGQMACALNKFISQLVTTYDLQKGKDPLSKRRGLKGIRLKDDFD